MKYFDNEYIKDKFLHNAMFLFIFLLTSICTSYIRSFTSSNVIDSELEMVYIPQKYHCGPSNTGFHIFYKAICPCSYYHKNVFVYLILKVGTDGSIA